MERIAVVDYGMGNLRSVAKALEHVAAARSGRRRVEVRITGRAEDVAGADRVVFPGQGAIRDCMAGIDAQGLRPVLLDAIGSKPFLGICIGLQALMERSQEDAATRGLGVLAGEVLRFDGTDPHTGARLKVPHMGWNDLCEVSAHPLWRGIEAGERFYFVHSYYVAPAAAQAVAARARYGVEFAAAAARDRVFAVQFHPEKSQRAGLVLLENFLDWDGRA